MEKVAVEVGASIDEGRLADALRACELLELEGAGMNEVPLGEGPNASTRCLKIQLVLYLLREDLCNARFLWKRITNSIKESDPELQQLWAIGLSMWRGDVDECYTAMRKEWSGDVLRLVRQLEEQLREKKMRQIGTVYTSISLGQTAHMLGLTEEETKNVTAQQGWKFVEESGMILPSSKEDLVPTERQDLDVSQLYELTDLITYLESATSIPPAPKLPGN